MKEKELISAIKGYIDTLSVGDYIYPHRLHEQYYANMQDVYKILEYTFSENVRPVFEVYCPHCFKFTGKRFESIFEFPDELVCPNCQNPITDLLQNSIVIYKKI